MYRTRYVDGELMSLDTTQHPVRRPLQARSSPSPRRTMGPPQLHRKLPLKLAAWLDDAQTQGSIDTTFIITFRDTLRLPRFPMFQNLDFEDEARKARRLERVHALIERIKEHRAAGYRRLEPRLAEEFGAKVLETFWLLKAIVVRMPIGKVRALSRLDEVVSIELRHAEGSLLEMGARSGNIRGDDVIAARTLLGSNPFNHMTTERIGLLDTGVQISHSMLTNPSNLGVMLDCVDGDADCVGGNPDEASCNGHHGTSSAALLAGNSNLGLESRGVTRMVIDSYKVYCNGTDSQAIQRALQRAVEVGSSVILIQQAIDWSDGSSISRAADRAFDAGAVVLAAVGNNGIYGDSTVTAPANAHKVIGVGANDVEPPHDWYSSSSIGPAPDGRIKPDVMAPTNTYTAYADASSDTTRNAFSGTSGAAPFAAALAAIIRQRLREATEIVDPGYVYAHLILAGQHTYPFNDTTGAGPLRLLDPSGLHFWGKIDIDAGEVVDIPIDLGDGQFSLLDGALWWPEDYDQEHNNLDLFLIDPAGAVADSSTSGPSIFERARAVDSSMTGLWTLRIAATEVQAGPQTVYWAAHTKTSRGDLGSP